MYDSLLSWIIFIPLIGAALIVLLPSSWKQGPKWIALSATTLDLILGVALYLHLKSTNEDDWSVFLSERTAWFTLDLGRLGQWAADYHLGLDGLNVALVLLSLLVMWVGVIASWRVTKRPKGYFALYLLLTGSVLGTFLALDLLLFYLFFEFMLLPMYFLIGIWGGKRREYASIKFFLYTLVGSLFILAVMIGLYASTQYAPELLGPNTIHEGSPPVAGMEQAPVMIRQLDLTLLPSPGIYQADGVLAPTHEGTWLGFSLRAIAFLLLVVGFGIKLPMVPFHTWLPDAHVEASTPISVVLAGVLLKIGGYGLLRIAYPIFPEQAEAFAPLVGGLGVLAIVYGAYTALAQTDLKKLIAYSSVSHMGFVLLGLGALTHEGINGAIYQMFSHGFISPLLFLGVGVLYDRTQNRTIADYRGLGQVMPKYTALIGIAFFASLGLPGFSGFIAELFTLIGAFSATVLPLWMPIVALLGIILGAGYYLWTLQRMFFGTLQLRDPSWQAKLQDLTPREYILMVPLTVATLYFGLFPQTALSWMNPTVSRWLESFHRHADLILQLSGA